MGLPPPCDYHNSTLRLLVISSSLFLPPCTDFRIPESDQFMTFIVNIKIEQVPVPADPRNVDFSSQEQQNLNLIHLCDN